MPIKNWPIEDRPREKLLAKGEQALTDAELIAIFLQSGTHGATALDIAKELLKEHGTLKKLFSTASRTIMQKRGIGLAKYVTLKAAVELGKRYLREPVAIGEVLNNSTAAQAFLSARMQSYEKEVFACLFMDNCYRLIRFEEMFYGTLSEASVYPREIVKQALFHNAAKVILAHNHPSGIPQPSHADKEITIHIKKALQLVDIDVIDHIIVGKPHLFSFADMGLV